MVTKQEFKQKYRERCSVLAKILMVTKLKEVINERIKCSVLAKILMVTKPNIYV